MKIFSSIVFMLISIAPTVNAGSLESTIYVCGKDKNLSCQDFLSTFNWMVSKNRDLRVIGAKCVDANKEYKKMERESNAKFLLSSKCDEIFMAKLEGRYLIFPLMRMSFSQNEILKKKLGNSLSKFNAFLGILRNLDGISASADLLKSSVNVSFNFFSNDVQHPNISSYLKSKILFAARDILCKIRKWSKIKYENKEGFLRYYEDRNSQPAGIGSFIIPATLVTEIISGKKPGSFNNAEVLKLNSQDSVFKDTNLHLWKNVRVTGLKEWVIALSKPRSRCTKYEDCLAWFSLYDDGGPKQLDFFDQLDHRGDDSWKSDPISERDGNFYIGCRQ